MNIREMIDIINNSQQYFYHGSNHKLPVGTILYGRKNEYESDWENTDFYSILEKYRPENMLSHADAVFMVADIDDIELAGGGTDWLFHVKPLGIVQKHDMNWSSELSYLISNHASEIDITEAALNYWNGIPHPNESIWEYLTPAAKIITVEKYN